MSSERYSRHARNRATSRNIPPGISEFILEYGDSIKTRDGALKYGLSKSGFRQLKRDYGPEIAKAVQRYRAAYVVECGGLIVTCAFARKPLFR